MRLRTGYIVNSFQREGFALHTMQRRLTGFLQGLACALVVLRLAASASLCQEFSFSSITEGLSNLNVNCMAQDHTGYLWVGTENGLYRYDGRAFRQFGAGDGLRGHMVQSLFADGDGTLFVGTTDGIYFERRNGQFAEIHPPAPVSDFSQRIGRSLPRLPPARW